MVLSVLADPAQFIHDRHADFREMLGIADIRELHPGGRWRINPPAMVPPGRRRVSPAARLGKTHSPKRAAAHKLFSDPSSLSEARSCDF
jgi:hypothetical protein